MHLHHSQPGRRQIGRLWGQRSFVAFVSVILGLIAGGCSDSARPLASGTAMSGTIWQKPLSAPSNEGNRIPSDARVEVYERLIIVHRPDGTRQIAPLEHVTDLRLR